MTQVLFSGGAFGADMCFTKCALKAGHKVVNYSFDGHNSKAPEETILILSQEQLDQYLYHLESLAEKIWRKVPKHGFIRNLLLRNFFQVEYSKMIFAVSHFNSQGMVNGGTAWAVYRGIELGIPVFVFDQFKKTWMEFSKKSWFYVPESDIEIPKGINYTGIGSRKLLPVGERAIEKLYEKV